MNLTNGVNVSGLNMNYFNERNFNSPFIHPTKVNELSVIEWNDNGVMNSINFTPRPKHGVN